MTLSDIISIQSTLAETTLHNIELSDNKLFKDLDAGKIFRNVFVNFLRNSCMVYSLKLCFRCYKKFRFMLL